MKVDKFINSKRVNYMNIPKAFKRNAKSDNLNYTFKPQRLFYSYDVVFDKKLLMKEKIP